jgi:hypothetical protein
MQKTRPAPRWLQIGLGALAVGYFGTVLLDVSGVDIRKGLPGALAYFAQVACLFPRAATDIIEYRAEGIRCADGTRLEVDTRPFFLTRANDKENRFDRALFFFRRNARTLAALDEYIVAGYNARAAPADRIGAIELFSLRLPLPQPGQSFERYHRRPLAEIPTRFRKHWYTTPAELRGRRCQSGETR